jgi:hypothetical protein
MASSRGNRAERPSQGPCPSVAGRGRRERVPTTHVGLPEDREFIVEDHPIVTVAQRESEENFRCGELFHARDGQAFVGLVIGGHRECLPLRSNEFRRWLERHHYESTGRMPTSTALRSVVRMLECRALEGPEREVYIRVVRRDGRVYLDLADDRRRVVEVGPDGWRVIDNPPVHFLRGPELRPLPVPEAGGSIEMLRSRMNVDDDALILVVAWLLDAFRVGYEHPILVIEGAEGSAKSTLLSILQALLDPAIGPTPGLPRSERELLSEAGTGYLRAYDNVPAISTAMSNALCRLVTAGGPPIVMASIERMVLRRDLADRCVFVTCDPKQNCQPRSVLFAEIERSLPKIMGVFLHVLSHGLRELPNVRPENLTRMADFELWSNACETALWPKGTFSAAYRANRAAAAEDQLDADPVASAVRILMAGRSTWSGNATKLHVTLSPTLETMGTIGKPVSPRDLSVKLRKAVPSLRKLGIEIAFERHGHGRDRIISISAAAGPNTLSEPLAPSSSASSAPSSKQDCWGSDGAAETNADDGDRWNQADDADDADASMQ